MKNLKEYIRESILDDIDDQLESGTDEILKNKIFDYISKHYFLAPQEFRKTLPWNKSKLKINLKTDPPTVDCMGSLIFYNEEPALTNGMFQWGKINGGFRCAYHKSLKSLEGAPKVVKGEFRCNNCKVLESLKGSPKTIDGDFDCAHCDSLTSLEGSPEKVGGGFYCYSCKSLKSLEGAPKEVERVFSCSGCTSLESLKGAPKEVGEYFNCTRCKVQFTEDDVKKISNVKDEIYC